MKSIDHYIRRAAQKITKPWELIAHAGDKYLCPLCNYSSKDWALTGLDFPVIREKQIIGAGTRHAVCHKCGSSDRERLVYVYLTQRLQFFADRNKSVLHIAPELSLSKKLMPMGLRQYICGDLHASGYHYPSHVQNINVLAIPFDDHSFDLVICNHVLEHIPDDVAAMKEIYRVLKAAGRAVLQVPISANSAKTHEDFSITGPAERERAFGQFDHVRIYGQDYVDRLQSCGFNVNRQNISADYPKFGLNLEEDLFVAEK
ncbi:MAG: class I SAM-dependent methyltransferase [Nevskiaceae bacterium]|jgi:SAM-dependent methyltransferase|nr:class I SAM-dependent methyltransferase [Nevskiaceae bacterium]